MSIEDVLNYKPSADEDYYALLGCDESSSVEQITAEYKALALQYHPDKNEGNKDAEAKFQLLKHAKETLCDPEKRSNYDKWRHSGVSVSYKQWLGMKDSAKTMHWSTPKTKDRMLPDSEGSGPTTAAASAAGSALGRTKMQAANANRRASEGGANIHYGARRDLNWDNQPPSEIVNKFRNYEV
ncbi:J domain-containing protein [Copidosoma floridanum]|uniref:J domain-containing protein n=1 Tax=Copidosoma floridanum TaxID=29053 RepID=UPI0006C9B011|nr:J domain-containing protein [Copidosoma floridanum]